MNVSCPDCRTVYRVDPAKVPASGVRARCARCPAEFLVAAMAGAVAGDSMADGGIAALDSGSHSFDGATESDSPAGFGTDTAGAWESEGDRVGDEYEGDAATVEARALEADVEVEDSTEPASALDDTSEPIQADEDEYPGSADDSTIRAIGIAVEEATEAPREFDPDGGSVHLVSDNASGTEDEVDSRDPDVVDAGGSNVAEFDSADSGSSTAEYGEDGVEAPAGAPQVQAEAPNDSPEQDAEPAPATMESPVVEPLPAAEVESAIDATSTSETLGAPAPEAVEAEAAPEPEILEAMETPVGFSEIQRQDGSADDELPPAPFGSTDPHRRAQRLARALVSDILVYHPDRRERSLRNGTVRQEFREEIRKSWDEYVTNVGTQMARDTTYFRDALNELLAGGGDVF